MSERILTAEEVAALSDFADTVTCDPLDLVRAKVRALRDSHEALRARVTELEAKLADFRAELPW